MGSGAIKWHVHCSVCGAFIRKERNKAIQKWSDKKCRSNIGDI